MNYKSILRMLLLIIVVAIVSCSHKTDLKQTNHSAIYVLNKTRAAMDPDGKIGRLKSIKCEYYTVTINQLTGKKTSTAKTFYFKQPERYKLIISSRFQKEEYIFDGKILSKKTDEQEREDLPEQGNMQEKLYDFKDNLTFCVFTFLYQLNLHNNEIYQIGGYSCYKLSATLLNKYRDGSDKLTYYIDNKEFLIRALKTDFGKIKKIRYKVFDNVKVPVYYELLEHDPGKEIHIWDIANIEFNPKLNDDIFIINSKNLGKEL